MCNIFALITIQKKSSYSLGEQFGWKPEQTPWSIYSKHNAAK